MTDPLDEEQVRHTHDDLTAYHNPILPPELATEQARLDARDEVPPPPSPLRSRYLTRIAVFLFLAAAFVGVTFYGMALRPFLTWDLGPVGVSAWVVSGLLAAECVFAALIYAEAYVLAGRHER